ncbi:MAG TPA: fatty acid desaturase [Nitrospirales bacterium]|jgi:fatty acid desaturase
MDRVHAHVDVRDAAFRTIAEHIAIPGKTGWYAIRHIRAPLIERILFAPFNINHHIAHHLFPRVPCYNLPKLHALIEAHPQFKSFDGCVKQSYLGLKSGVMGELIGPIPVVVSSVSSA